MDYVINPNTLKTLRQKKFWTQADLAHKSGVDRKTVMRIEKGAPYRVRANSANNLAKSLNVSIEILQNELPDSENNRDSQIFIDLEKSLQENDHASAMRIIEYLTCKLAYALNACQIEMDDGWISKLHNVAKPAPALTPEWQPYFEDTEPYEGAFSTFLKELQSDREKAAQDAKSEDGVVLPASTDYFLCGDLPHDLKEAFLRLPIKLNGQIDAYRVRAYFRKMTRFPSGNLQLVLVPNSDEEMWTVVTYSEG